MTRLDDALAFWKDAVRQYWEAINNPSKNLMDAAEAYGYYLRARENLEKAWSAK